MLMIAWVCFTDILCVIQVLVTEYNTITVDVRDWISIHSCKSSIMSSNFISKILITYGFLVALLKLL